MPAFISISNFILSAFLLVLSTSIAWSDDAPGPATSAPQIGQPEEEDFSASPYTKYGEFQDIEDEEEETLFFQYGRFFGVSLGLGQQGAMGNRGGVWQGGFPMFSVKVHYWFDFNFALALEYSTGSQYFEGGREGGHHDVKLSRMGVDLKYYVETKDVSAAIAFASPYLLFGIGNYTKSEAEESVDAAADENSFGVDFGGGLEFTLKPKKTFFTLEGKLHSVQFEDTYSRRYLSVLGREDMSGLIYTFVGSFLFTW